MNIIWIQMNQIYIKWLFCHNFPIVAIQCLEAAFEVNTIDGLLQTNKKLENIFEDYLKSDQSVRIVE